MRLIKLHSSINYQASARNHVIFLPEVDMSPEAIYPVPAKEPIREDNAAFQSFSQPIEGTHVPNPPAPTGLVAGQLRLLHRANTDATASTVAQRPQKHARVLDDKELLVSLHQKQDRHHDWLKRQMQSLLIDVNQCNLTTKNSFVTHEAFRRLSVSKPADLG